MSSISLSSTPSSPSRLVLEHLHHVVGRGRGVDVAGDDERAAGRAVDQVHGRLEHGHAGALGAGERPGDVEAVLGQQVVEVVAGDAARDLRVPLADQVAVAVGERTQPRGELVGHARAVGADAEALAAVGQHLELGHVVGRPRPGAVELRHHRVHAAGVVADHPAERAVVVGRRVGAEGEPVLAVGLLAQPVEDDARLDARELPLGVDLDDPVQVLGEVEDDRDVHALTREARAAAAREDRRAVLAGDRDRGDHVVDAPRDHDADRQLAVVGARRGVERAVAGAEADLAVDRVAQRRLERGGIDVRGGAAPSGGEALGVCALQLDAEPGTIEVGAHGAALRLEEAVEQHPLDPHVVVEPLEVAELRHGAERMGVDRRARCGRRGRARAPPRSPPPRGDR